ncbi:OB-fold domain-containing protein [Candidatus Gottesmanbacteria bacterium]|nr:OB-fold domain-containing protein [Candidatus Gottesmanbacteria bacterium]
MNNISPVKIWRNQKKIASLIGKIGVIESFTIIFVPPSGFEGQVPYPVALASFGKSKLTASIVDCDLDKVKIGAVVEVVLRRVKKTDREGVIPYGAKFKLISK